MSIHARAAGIRLSLFDVDGVLTEVGAVTSDGGIVRELIELVLRARVEWESLLASSVGHSRRGASA